LLYCTLSSGSEAFLYTGNSTASYAIYATTQYTYNYLGNLVQILHPGGTISSTFQYDMLGRQTGMTDPDRGTESYVYDPNGNVLQTVDARGSAGTIYAGYDGLNRQLWRNTTNSASGAYATYSYDSTANGNQGIGRLTGETFTGGPNHSLSGSYSDVYDVRGQEIQTTLTVGGTSYPTSTSYDDAGNVLSQTYPNGDILTTSYTSQGWFAGLTLQQGATDTTLLSNLSYTGISGAAGLFSSASLNGGTYTETDTYDQLLRLTDQKVTRSSNQATIFEEQPSYDAASRVIGITTTLPQGTDVQAFCYDEQNRLTWAGSVGTPPCTGTAISPGTLTAAQYTQSFAYDTLGRLTSGPLGSYTYGSSQHVHAATSIGSGYTATYDAAGNMTCRAPTSATTCTGSTPTGNQLSYDNEGRLVAWQNTPSSPSTTEGYLYDGEGNRVEQQITQNGTTTTTVYVGGIEEVTTSGTTTTTKTYYGTIAMAVNGVVSYLVTNGLGSVTVALDTSGNVQASQLNTPYGGQRYSSGTMPTTIGFTGQRLDAITGLYYFGARYYDPQAGQFISADTILPGGGFDPWGLSRYAYVAGNPIGRVDPTGHNWWDDFWGSDTGKGVHSFLNDVFNLDGMGYDLHTLFTDPDIGHRAAAGFDLAMWFIADEFMVGELAGAFHEGAGGNGDDADHPTTDEPHGIDTSVTGLDSTPDDGVVRPHRIDTTDDGSGEGGGGGGGGGGSGGGDGGCGQSFSADTLVATPTGEQSISSLQVGDHVQAYDPQTHQESTQTVEKVWVNHDTDLLDVTLQAVDTPKSQASEQSLENEVVTQHLPATIARTEEKNLAQESASTGKGSLAPLTDAGQDETIHTTASHPWLTADYGWVRAGNLAVGEPVVRADGQLAVVVMIRVIPGTGIRYDLTVSQVHTFEVGYGQWVVHNCGDPPNYNNTQANPDQSNPNEVAAAKYLATIRPDSEVELRDPSGRRSTDGKTSDLVVDGVNYNVKTPEAGTSVQNILNRAAKAFTQGRGVVINLSKSPLTEADFGDYMYRIRKSIESWGYDPNTIREVIFYDPK
jgi:RHS repeat-associated protein